MPNGLSKWINYLPKIPWWTIIQSNSYFTAYSINGKVNEVENKIFDVFSFAYTINPFYT